MPAFPGLPPNFDKNANQSRISKAGRIPQPAFKVSRSAKFELCARAVSAEWKNIFLGFNCSIIHPCHSLRCQPNGHTGLFSLSTVSWRLSGNYCPALSLRRNWPGLCILSKHFRHSGCQRRPIDHHTAWWIRQPCTYLCHSWFFPVCNVDVYFRG